MAWANSREGVADIIMLTHDRPTAWTVDELDALMHCLPDGSATHRAAGETGLTMQEWMMARVGDLLTSIGVGLGGKKASKDQLVLESIKKNRAGGINSDSVRQELRDRVIADQQRKILEQEKQS